MLVICPEYIGERSRLARMTACVAGVVVGDVADDLRRRDPVGQERERRRRVVAGLHVEPGPVDRPAVEPRRRAGLEPPERKAEAGEGLRQAERRRFADPARRDLLLADMDEAVEKRAGRQHHPAGREPPAVAEHEPADPPVAVEQQILGRALDDVETGRFGQQFADRRGDRACGRPGRAGPRTAAPLLRFRMRNWIPARSIARPMTPSSASISRTRCPLPSPPIAGLHDISPIVARLCVSSSVRAPSRAAAAAASQPACPPPTTTTS